SLRIGAGGPRADGGHVDGVMRGLQSHVVEAQAGPAERAVARAYRAVQRQCAPAFHLISWTALLHVEHAPGTVAAALHAAQRQVAQMVALRLLGLALLLRLGISRRRVLPLCFAAGVE